MPGDSPYFTGAAPNFGPPSGLAGLLAQNREGSVDFKGAQLFADAVDKFKQEQDMGKAADYFVKANPQALAQMGVHPEQWKTLGSRDKTSAVTGFMKGQAQQELMQKLADMARERQAEDDFAASMRDASVGTMPMEAPGLMTRTLGPMQVPVSRAPTMDSFARAAAGRPNAWTARGAAPLLHALAADGGFTFNPQTDIKPLTEMPGTFVVKTSKGGGQVVQDPRALAAAAEAKRKPEDGTIEIPDPENPVFGPRIRIPLSVAKKEYPHLLKGLNAGAAGAAPDAPTHPKDRKPNTIYKTPKGELKWTGTGWVSP